LEEGGICRLVGRVAHRRDPKIAREERAVVREVASGIATTVARFAPKMA
jgi:hypothetical protein